MARKGGSGCRGFGRCCLPAGPGVPVRLAPMPGLTDYVAKGAGILPRMDVLGMLPDWLRPGRGEVPPPDDLPDAALPVVWLLGKTGAGKTSLIRLVTGRSDAEIGNGFQPCTRTAVKYDYPPDQPLVRFLDTRGLGETAYDPTEDLAACRDHSHVILVMCRLDDPVQGMVAEALAQVARREKRTAAILVHTGADLIDDPAARERAERTTEAMMKKALGRKLTSVTIAMPPGGAPDEAGRAALVDRLLEVLPAAGILLRRKAVMTAEEKAFEAVRNRVLFYAGIAGSSDLAPVIGAVSVPATQMAMLRELGQHYEVPWTRSVMASFAGALGLGFGVRFAGSYGLRQLTKLIPVVGQTVGAAFSGSISFAVTYALGRAAAYYLHNYASGKVPPSEEIRQVYARAFRRGSNAPD
jgi:uncharacterized protein (DUF697 family)